MRQTITLLQRALKETSAKHPEASWRILTKRTAFYRQAQKQFATKAKSKQTGGRLAPNLFKAGSSQEQSCKLKSSTYFWGLSAGIVAVGGGIYLNQRHGYPPIILPLSLKMSRFSHKPSYEAKKTFKKLRAMIAEFKEIYQETLVECERADGPRRSWLFMKWGAHDVAELIDRSRQHKEALKSTIDKAERAFKQFHEQECKRVEDVFLPAVQEFEKAVLIFPRISRRVKKEKDWWYYGTFYSYDTIVRDGNGPLWAIYSREQVMFKDLYLYVEKFRAYLVAQQKRYYQEQQDTIKIEVQEEFEQFKKTFLRLFKKFGKKRIAHLDCSFNEMPNLDILRKQIDEAQSDFEENVSSKTKDLGMSISGHT